MAQATTTQISNLEAIHKQQLRDLIAGWQLFHVAKNVTAAEKKSRSDFAKSLIKLTANWLKRNLYFERDAKIPRSIFVIPGILPGFIDKARFEGKIMPAAGYYIYQQKTNDNTQSIGFIPLLIWAAIALIAYFTVDTVVTNTNNTVADKNELVNSTNKFCADNKLTPEQCSNLLNQSLTPTPPADGSGGGGFFGSIKTLALWGAAAFVGIKFILPEIQKQTSKSKPANG